MTTCFIGVGSNLGNRRLQIKKAVRLLAESGGITVKRQSSVYETEPEGGPAGQNKFLNGVIGIETSLEPEVLLKKIHGVEKKLKRRRTVKNGPRTIDLDILVYGSRVIQGRTLLIPHPRISERAFVLKGFSEIAPDFIHPVLNRSIGEIYNESHKKHIRNGKRIIGPAAER